VHLALQCPERLLIDALTSDDHQPPAQLVEFLTAEDVGQPLPRVFGMLTAVVFDDQPEVLVREVVTSAPADGGLRRLPTVVRADSLAYLTSARRGNVTCVAPLDGGAAPHNSAAVWWLMYDPRDTSLRTAFALSSGVIAMSRATYASQKIL
jgi:hypothetical protein